MMRIISLFILSGLLLSMTACDSVLPVDVGTLVVESYLQAGEPLPSIRVSKTYAVSEGLVDKNGVADASVILILDGIRITYEPDVERPGLFFPPASHQDTIVPPLAAFNVQIESGSDTATAKGTVPPIIRLDNVDIFVPEMAIEAILLDTLDIGIDSLDLALNAQEGYIFPIQVSLFWQRAEPSSSIQSDYWIETRLKPVSEFSSSLIDFFLLPRQVLPESRTITQGTSSRSWSGVYAVPVDSADASLPDHFLTVSILRGDQAFAVFESSRDSPQRREPVSNVTGGIGFVGGISLDTLRILVK